MTKPFLWGIIGPGRIAHRFAQALAHSGCGNLHAVASRNQDRARSFAQQYNAAVYYDNYQQMIADPEIDGIYIATPHNFHFDAAKRCLEAGKPVLCEKPLTVNTAQTQRLIELAQQHQTFLMEALWTRMLPVYQQVRQWLDSNAIGDVKLVQSNFGFCIDRNQEDRLLNPELAGGVLLDMGVYNLSMSDWVYGRGPISTQVTGMIGDTGVDELMAVNLDFGHGQFGQFTCNFLCKTDNHLTIYGSKGHIRVDQMFWDTGRAKLVVEQQPDVEFDQPYDASGFEYQIMEAERCIRAGWLESPEIPHATTLRTVEAIDRLRTLVGLPK
ncbi:Gfo/Idh/MocA family oxidoreductase [Neiella marina]|uniref:Gfo/Idh/MocA family oxidoreductase n=1 Tax=Neiella holothuriorum TaxID=2870530 RepID=A0ABS7EJM7_9GAMM|nr:Gfo/Idh/MocA family oxidoreductase [Neiella holothuriorum]MBW8192549.1 Gfo/Idh/MocA family oxidoreductase [Neiella holothuriorum]